MTNFLYSREYIFCGVEMNRREFLAFALLLPGCASAENLGHKIETLSKYSNLASIVDDYQTFTSSVNGKRRSYKVYTRPRKPPVSLNPEGVLRRYADMPVGDVEDSLMQLAFDAKKEYAISHCTPGGWIETAPFSDNSKADVDGKSLYQFALTDVALSLLPWGILKDFPKPKKIVHYHTHPIEAIFRNCGSDYFSGKTCSRPEDIVFFPSSVDLVTHARRKAVTSHKKIAFHSKVVVPDGIIDYDVSDNMVKKILSSKRPFSLKELNLYSVVRKNHLEGGHNAEDFTRLLSLMLMQSGGKGDEFMIFYDKRR